MRMQKTKNLTFIIMLAVFFVGLGWYFIRERRPSSGQDLQGQGQAWYCPMHPWIKSDKPGVCPICGMALVPGHQHQEAAKSDIPGYVSFDITKEKQQLASLRTAIVDQKTVAKTIRAAGTLGDIKGEVFAEVFESDMLLIKAGQKAVIEIPSYHETYNGTVISIDPAINPDSRTARVRMYADIPGKPHANMFVSVSMQVPIKDAVIVPRDAVMDTGLRKLVFVEKEEGRFEPRLIQTGWETDDGFEVKSGLKEGERIVVSGNFLLDSEARVQAVLQEGGGNAS